MAPSNVLMTVAKPCPSTHPFQVGNGHYCCKHYLRKSGSGFDGGELLYSDPPEACRNDAIVQVSSEDSDQKYKQNDNALSKFESKSVGSF